MHDRPAKMFADLDITGQHELFHRLSIFQYVLFILIIIHTSVPGSIIMIVDPIANLKGHYFKPSLSVSLSVCVCVSDRHFYPSTLTDFDETWSQGPYSDLVWPRP